MITNLSILLLGDSDSGKTSLLMRYVKNQYKENYISTVGLDSLVKNLIINEEDVRLHIMDTSGQERFKSLSQSYYNKVDGIIFVLDVTNMESYEGVKFWLKDAFSYNKEIVYVIVGNKIDLKNIIVVNENDIKSEEIFKDIKYFETSAKENTNVEKPFEEIANLILQKLNEQGNLSVYDSIRRAGSFHIRNHNHNHNNSRKTHSNSCCEK